MQPKRHGVSQKSGLTLAELMVSIMITTMILVGAFFFISASMLSVVYVSDRSQFLKEFYSFSSLLREGDLEILHNYDEVDESYDVAMMEIPGKNTGIIVGVVDMDTKMLVSTGALNTYAETVLGMRNLSESEFALVEANPDIVYQMEFFPDKLFGNFNIKDFQLTAFNSDEILEMKVEVFPMYIGDLDGVDWDDISKEDVYSYTLNF